VKTNRFFSILLAILAIGATRPLSAQNDRLSFPGTSWGDPYARTISGLREQGYTPTPGAASAPSTHRFVNTEGDSVLAAYDANGGLEAVTFSARFVNENQTIAAFNQRAQEIAGALGAADSTASDLAIWIAGSGDELMLARDGIRLVEFYFSIEAAERLMAQVRSEEGGGEKGAGKADPAVGAADDAWLQQRIGGSRWSPLTVGDAVAISYDPRTTTAAGRRVYDTWTRWDHAQPEENAAGESFDSTAEHMKIDCAGRRMMTLQIVQYMDGHVVRTLPVPTPAW
jgi:hypothetical protein